MNYPQSVGSVERIGILNIFLIVIGLKGRVTLGLSK